MREFIKGNPKHVARYSNLKVRYIDHHNPDLVLYDASDAELQRIDLTRLSSTASMHRLMVLLGLAEVCAENNGSCANWAAQGECVSNPSFMLEECRLSCDACGEGAKKAEAMACRDYAAPRDCEYWSTMGECDGSNEAWMKEQCPRSCGHCTDMATGVGDEGDKDEL